MAPPNQDQTHGRALRRKARSAFACLLCGAAMVRRPCLTANRKRLDTILPDTCEIESHRGTQRDTKRRMLVQKGTRAFVTDRELTPQADQSAAWDWRSFPRKKIASYDELREHSRDSTVFGARRYWPKFAAWLDKRQRVVDDHANHPLAPRTGRKTRIASRRAASQY